MWFRLLVSREVVPTTRAERAVIHTIFLIVEVTSQELWQSHWKCWIRQRYLIFEETFPKERGAESLTEPKTLSRCCHARTEEEMAKALNLILWDVARAEWEGWEQSPSRGRSVRKSKCKDTTHTSPTTRTSPRGASCAMEALRKSGIPQTSAGAIQNEK